MVETELCYYLFDYEKGSLPYLNAKKPIFVLASHSHYDHYNPEIFSMLKAGGMQEIYAVLSDDIKIPADKNTLQVTTGEKYTLSLGQRLFTFKSTDLGVAFLIEEGQNTIYHAGDLNDWVWQEESDLYNQQMTNAYRKQIDLLAEILNGRKLNVAFVVLDPRQEKDYDRGMCYFLEQIAAEKVYPMHYWETPDIIETFLKEHSEYKNQIKKQN